MESNKLMATQIATMQEQLQKLILVQEEKQQQKKELNTIQRQKGLSYGGDSREVQGTIPQKVPFDKNNRKTN